MNLCWNGNQARRELRCGHIEKDDAIKLGVILLIMLGVSLFVLLEKGAPQENSSTNAAASLSFLEHAAGYVPLMAGGTLGATAIRYASRAAAHNDKPSRSFAGKIEIV